MNLKEFEGSAIFAKYGIPVPVNTLLDKRALDDEGVLSEKVEEFVNGNPEISKFALKAQLLKGGRGKSGGIIFSDLKDLTAKINELKKLDFGSEKIEQIMLEEKIHILKELYLSVTIDTFNRCPAIIFSTEGGIDIEETAAKNPFKMRRLPVDGLTNINEDLIEKGLLDGIDMNENQKKQFARIAYRLLKLFNEEDAILAEINPLCIDGNGSLLAVDSKVIIDDNALFRHPELTDKIERGYSKLENKARLSGLSYVELDGDLAVIGNGAGLVMATLDSVYEYGGRPANFCDVGGGADRHMMRTAMEIVLEKNSVKCLFINIFGGITHCDEIAAGMLDFIKADHPKLPVIVRIVGTNEEKARDLLEKENIKTYRNFDEAARAATEIIKK